MYYLVCRIGDDHLPDDVGISQLRLDRHKTGALKLDPKMLKSSFHRVREICLIMYQKREGSSDHEILFRGYINDEN